VEDILVTFFYTFGLLFVQEKKSDFILRHWRNASGRNSRQIKSFWAVFNKTNLCVALYSQQPAASSLLTQDSAVCPLLAQQPSAGFPPPLVKSFLELLMWSKGIEDLFLVLNWCCSSLQAERRPWASWWELNWRCSSLQAERRPWAAWWAGCLTSGWHQLPCAWEDYWSSTLNLESENDLVGCLLQPGSAQLSTAASLPDCTRLGERIALTTFTQDQVSQWLFFLAWKEYQATLVLRCSLDEKTGSL